MISYAELRADLLETERAFVSAVLIAEGSKKSAARALGISREALNRRLATLGIPCQVRGLPAPKGVPECRRRGCDKPVSPSRWLSRGYQRPSYCSNECRRLADTTHGRKPRRARRAS